MPDPVLSRSSLGCVHKLTEHYCTDVVVIFAFSFCVTHALITEIEFKYKKSEKSGEIKIGFRGDGTIVETWHKNINLETLVSRFMLGGSASRARTYNPAVNSRMLYH